MRRGNTQDGRGELPPVLGHQPRRLQCVRCRAANSAKRFGSPSAFRERFTHSNCSQGEKISQRKEEAAEKNNTHAGRSQATRGIPFLRRKPVLSLQDVGARRAPADWGRPFAAHAALQAGQHHLQPAGPHEPVRYLGGGPLLAQLCAEVCEGGPRPTRSIFCGWL